MEAHSSVPPPALLRSLRTIAPYFTPDAMRLALIALLAIGSASLAALEPLLLKALFDRFLAGRPLEAIASPLLGLAALLIGAEVVGALLERVVWRVRLAVDFRLLQDTVDRLHALPLAYHREESVGALMTKIERGISGCMNAFSQSVVHLLPALTYLGVSAAVMFALEWRLAIAVAVFAPLPALLGAWASREQMRRERALMERWTSIYARFNEVLGGIAMVKSFVMEEREKRRFLHAVRDANAVVARGVATDSNTNAGKNLLIAVARLCALALGGILVARQSMSAGTLIAFVGYLGGVFRPVQTLITAYQTVARASVSLDALRSILEARQGIEDAPQARELPAVRGTVEFRDVGFGYGNGNGRPLLDGIDLQVEAGEMVALVGPSGTGKTTLMALLQRLYEPTAGAILVDGADIRELKQRWLRSQIGVVLQEGVLLNDTIGENIAFGRPGASAAEIERAARAANAHEFIAALPEGYDTRVGERGCKLSGGERQRIAIARALLKDAPILILDEATSALDAEVEEKVQEAIARLVRGRTTFVIAHRLSTITAADRIVVLKDGAVHESGDHDHLMRAGGYYASLVRRQVRGLIADAA
jgi:ATP-binding cassette subfamily B protein